MMNNMPPEMRERMQASMAQRNARRSGRGAGSANSIPSHAGVPVPMDSVLYTSFARLKTQSGYHMVMTMQTNDPKMAAMAQSIFSPQEMLVVGNTRQYTMHYKMPATDVPERWMIGKSGRWCKTAGRRGSSLRRRCLGC